MKFHKEGYPTLILALLFSAALIFFTHRFIYEFTLLRFSVYFICAFLLVIVIQFFRSPSRNTPYDETAVISPADGKVVVIEEVEETEYFKDKRIQVSVFMSPINVHVNRFPINGLVKFVKYHPGKYLVAWHPKSSTENERTTIVVEKEAGKSILFRQIAGALARRIVFYCKEGQQAQQGNEFGFIKFGSRVDVFFPIGSDIKVALNQKVTGGETVLGFLK
ncbi:MAG: phosphatidylserine decarboxylase family protein [Bacteroidetes bacterium]|nr:phosphatidylserine decarboxylase family protein [Bacteroidota bacterium]